MSIADESLQSTGQLFDVGTTCGRFLPTPQTRDYHAHGATHNRKAHSSTLATLAKIGELTSFAAASPAKTLATPDGEPELLAGVADSGPNLPVSFAFFDRNTCSWKTWQRCLDGDLAEFSQTFPNAGMTRNGTAYRLRPSVLPISGIGSFCWPTPQAADSCKKKARPPRLKKDRATRTGNTPGDYRADLADAVVYYPTPTARDYRSPGTPERLARARRESSRGQPLTEEIGGQLNPTWVEALMGFPSGWSDVSEED